MNSADATAARDEALAALLAAPPPRVVSAALRRAAYRQSAPMVIGVFGGIFLAVGLFFAAMFFPWNFYRDWQLATGDTAVANGRVLSVGDTKLQINKQRVVRYAFSFQPPTGAPVQGECFTTGRRWNERAAVTVRYRPENPAVCCLAGARSSEGTLGMTFVLLFPGIGGALVAWTAISRRRMRALLERGLVGEALVTDLRQTMVRVNNQYVHKIALQRTDSPSGGGFTVSSYQPAVIAFARGRLESKQPVFVLYDPMKPNRAILPEAL